VHFACIQKAKPYLEQYCQPALEVFKDRSWFEGSFWWRWGTNPNAEGPTERARMRVPKFSSRQLVFSGLILGRMMVCLDAESAV
jgi:hypothetical protein